MKRFRLAALAMLAFLVLTGCSGVLDSLREESEEAERDARREDEFHGAKANKGRGYRGLSANNVSDYGTVESKRARAKMDDAFDDAEQRVQDVAEETRRRYNRADFVDGQSNENSLWNAQGQSNYYFAQNNRFDNGDLVIVGVDRSLKREIQYALWKSLPSEQRRIKRKPASEAADKAKAAATTAAAAATPGAPAPTGREAEERAAAEEAAKSSMGADQDGDLIRMEIMENLGNGLVRLKGEKRVIYRGRPKFVEVSGLVRNSDIDDQSKTNSKSFLDIRSRVIQ